MVLIVPKTMVVRTYTSLILRNKAVRVTFESKFSRQYQMQHQQQYCHQHTTTTKCSTYTGATADTSTGTGTTGTW